RVRSASLSREMPIWLPLQHPITVQHPALAPPELHTLSLHDALPISPGTFTVTSSHTYASRGVWTVHTAVSDSGGSTLNLTSQVQDRKSTRLNSSHLVISYAVFCLKKKIRRQTVSPRPARFIASRFPI